MAGEAGAVGLKRGARDPGEEREEGGEGEFQEVGRADADAGAHARAHQIYYAWGRMRGCAEWWWSRW